MAGPGLDVLASQIRIVSGKRVPCHGAAQVWVQQQPEQPPKRVKNGRDFKELDKHQKE